MRRLSSRPFVIAVAFAAVGFLLLFLAWNAAAELDHVSGQMPILISGGLTGLGLIAVGLTMAVTAELRRTTATLRDELTELTDLVAAALPTATGPTAVPADGDGVVAGRATFHLPSCHLVVARDDLQRMDPDVARDRGLQPCRICKPTAEVS